MIRGGAYAFLESLDTYAGEVHARFDAIPKDLGDRILEGRADTGNLLSELPSFFIHAFAPEKNVDALVESWNRGLSENRWYQFQVGQGRVSAEFYTNGLERQEVVIGSPEPLDGRSRLGRVLHRTFSLNEMEDASIGEIEAALTVPRSKTGETNLPAYFAVYDVGQGNCNAVCSTDGAPVLYFDMGGGMGRNARTYQNRKRFCFTKKPPVILSHWDKDHWFSGLYAPIGHPKTDVLNSKWIVPRQKIGPSALKLAMKLHVKSNLLIWPKGRRRLHTTFGEISLCGGASTSKNDSGLALLATVGAHTILAPGDANYRHIPMSISSVDFLIASHHGGALRCKKLPQPSAGGHSKIVFSFGRGNYEKHPNWQMVRRYTSAGWNSRMATTKGNIGVGLSSAGPQGCLGNFCDLKIVQIK